MIVAAQQPYFAPYPGFFLKAFLADAVVIMDRVQLPLKSTWITRNRFKNSEGMLWLKVPVWKKGLGLQTISDVRICDERGWRRKHIEGLEAAYGNAPFFKDHLPFLEALYSECHERLCELNLKIIRYLFGCLGIKAQLRLLSEMEVDAKEPLLSVEIARSCGASHFLAQSSARNFLDKKAFRQSGIELVFFTRRPVPYPQLWAGGFFRNLSVFDLLFNCGPKAPEIIMKELSKRDRRLIEFLGRT